MPAEKTKTIYLTGFGGYDQLQVGYSDVPKLSEDEVSFKQIIGIINIARTEFDRCESM